MLHERIKEMRKALGLTQQEFADRLNIKRGTMANYEIGRNEPIDAVISLICREFNVSETWLRTGKGEMFAPEQTDAWEEVVKRRGLSSGDRLLIEKFMNLKPAEREVVMKYVLSVAADYSAPAAPERTQPDTSGQERTGEQKMPIPVSEDGQDELEGLVRKYKKNLTDDQQQQILEMMQAMITSQKEPLPASAQRIVDEKSPKTERPGQS